MADFLKIIKLKQHTPLLHFQHEQDGATLRATELKPKIDAWIIRQETGINPKDSTLPEAEEKAVEAMLSRRPEWLVGGGRAQHPALDYKLHIRAEKAQEYLVASNIARQNKEELDRKKILYLDKAPYFADNEKIKKRQLKEAKRGIMWSNIELEIFCLDEDLMAKIVTAIPHVLAYNNFGIRQSKGFGGFSVSGQSIDDFEDLLRAHPLYKKSLVFRFPEREKVSLAKIFGKIENEYKILKSGFAKDPSQMQEYFQNKGIDWEKPIIKQELIFNKSLPKKEDHSSDTKKKYIRALLGVAELYEFPHDGEKIKVACDEEDPDAPGTTLVDRFRSPITFKVFNGNIYLLPGEIPEQLYGRTFIFTNSRKVSIKLSTPPKGSFDLADFLENHVEQSWEYV